MSSVTKKDLLLFFDRPMEPSFITKGEDGVIFQIPMNYFPKTLQAVSAELMSRFEKGVKRIVPVRDIQLPDLSVPKQLDFNDQFSVFIPKHVKMAAALINIFMEMRDLEELQSVCAYCQIHINPYLFNYSLSVAILHRKDTQGLNFPSYAEVFPGKFMDPRTLKRAREINAIETNKEKSQQMPVVIPINFTASDLEPEQWVAYFREDIGVNLHHWHWHLVYPADTVLSIVNKDRRGELFYYMHSQIIARYNAERLCNKLRRVSPYNNFFEPIPEAYFPKLESTVASRAWPPRFANSVMHNLHRPMQQIKSDVYDLELWRGRLQTAISEMAILLPDGSKMPLDEETGIDVLGNLVEATILSLNRAYYGNMHNMGHNFISYCHDPEDKYLELYGVMGDSSTAMRDPVFYRWHAFVDDLFQEYKNKLPPYGDKLDFPGIQVSSINVESVRGANRFSTHWEQSEVELDGGLDFTPRGSVLARFTHLQHDEFTYKINVHNSSGKDVMGTVRIFMAPTLNEEGNQLSFNDQRRLMIEMNKFSQSIPAGSSTISRISTESSVTIPYERVFRPQSNRPGKPGTPAAAEFDFCGCGWPHYMLIPKGTPEGYPVIIYVMISNWEEDRVEQDTTGTCKNAASYCGIRDRKYPDRRAMGFPFDRPIKANKITEFLKPNMAINDCTIHFTDKVQERPPQA